MKTPDPTLDWFTTAGNRELAPAAPAVADEITLHFDWVPAMVNGCVIFQVAIIRGATRSSIEFEVDLVRFDTNELERLHAILSRRHAGLDNGQEVAGSVAWLLDRSLAQTSNLDLEARHRAVRQLLLVDPR